jgi:hypothetical protein
VGHLGVRKPVREERLSFRLKRKIPVFRDISSKSSTTAFNNGIPSLIRIASASRSGSPGISGPWVPGAGLVFRKTWIHSSLKASWPSLPYRTLTKMGC